MSGQFAGAAALLGFTSIRYGSVTTEAGEFRYRSLSENEKSDFEASVLRKSGDFSIDEVKRQRKRLIIECLVDDEGNRLLKPDDEAALGNVDGRVTHQIYNDVREHVGLDEADIEELVKNSAAIRAADSQPT